jgi:CRISPR/Cas system-associated endonuclease Cas1
MLNYAYAVLENQVRIAVVAQSLDPAIGYLHACRRGSDRLTTPASKPILACTG